jgi:hypothetical protein
MEHTYLTVVSGMSLIVIITLVPNIVKGEAENWLSTCQSIQWALMQNCSTYVNPDGTLTSEGARVMTCRDLVSDAGGYLSQPPSVIINILEPLSRTAGCDGIVNWNVLRSSTNASDFLRTLIGR